MAESFTDYLARYRAKADVLAAASLTDAIVLGYVKDQDLAQHGSAVAYEFLGDDTAGAPVYRLGTLIILQDIQAHLDALVAARSITKVGGAKAAYSANPSLRK
jgi:hypothetical protein